MVGNLDPTGKLSEYSPLGFSILENLRMTYLRSRNRRLLVLRCWGEVKVLLMSDIALTRVILKSAV